MSSGGGATRVARATPSERVCDAVCAGFALWTLCCHAVVAAGGSLHALLATAAGAGALALVARARWRSPAGNGAPPAPEPGADDRARRLARGVGGALGAVAAAAWWGLHGDAIALWWSGAAVLLAAAGVFARPGPSAPPAARAGRAPELGLWGLALACVALTLVCHRPDIDDAFYVNVAVAAVDRPAEALLAGDTLHGIPGLPLHQPIYRLHSYELWNAAVAYLTGVPAIYAFHWISASLVALLIPLAHARLFRLLTPRHWPWAVAALVGVLLAAGETYRWYGNFAFVRAWQGKAVFLFVFTPLVYAHAIGFAQRPTRAGWGRLAAAQVAALGCSSTALWAAPVAALLALVCALRPDRAALRKLALGATASLYLIAAGAGFRGELQRYAEPLYTAHARGDSLQEALLTTLGSARLLLVVLTAVLAGWACWGRGLARRFAIAVPLGAWLVLLDPYTDAWIAANVTGPSTWRAMWALPVPILLALVLVAPLQIGGSARRRALGAATCAALCAGFALWVPSFHALSARNAGPAGGPLRVGLPSLKVPPSVYHWAAKLDAAVAPGALVVAPDYVSVWLPTFHRHAQPLMVRLPYLFRYRELLGEDELRARVEMTSTAGGAGGADAARAFREELRERDVKGALVSIGENAESLRAALSDAGFRRRLRGPDHEIWVRP